MFSNSLWKLWINCRGIEVLPLSCLFFIGDVLYSHAGRLRSETFGNFYFPCQVILTFCIGFVV